MIINAVIFQHILNLTRIKKIKSFDSFIISNIKIKITLCYINYTFFENESLNHQIHRKV